MPISSEAMKAPGKRAEAADHDDDEDDRPDRRRHVRLGDERVAADHAGQAGERAADAEHQHEHARHVVAERVDHVRMRERRLDDQADAGALEHDQQRHEASRPRQPS